METYTLHVVYTAYRLNEQGRPEENVFNGDGSPGTEVGTGTTIPTGYGRVTSENVHEVHVISGVIRIYKQLNDTASDVNRSFTFTLHRVENGTHEYDETRTITIPAGSKGPVSAEFYGLYRGTYIITEQETPNGEYRLTDIQVMDSTNSENSVTFTDTVKNVTFVMGHNKNGENVIGKAQNPSGGEDRYTSYIDPVNGVLGEVIFTNSTGVVLPATGGPGTNLYHFSGLLFVAAALVYRCALRRRYRKEAKN